MSNYIIRKINTNEIPLLEDFLYEAIFQRDNSNLIPKEVIKKPEVSIYIDNFGEKNDRCLVAEYDGNIVGAVWTRILSGEIKGFGNINNKTPEFAISIFKPYRNRGIGSDLMNSMLKWLKDDGYSQTSLAVQKDNYAVKMYKSIGFEIIKESDEEYLMICDLTTWK